MPIPDVPGDGVLDVEIDGEEDMAEVIDATIRLAMDQAFAGTRADAQAAFSASAVRLNNDANFVSTTTQLTHQLSAQMIGAKAAQNVEMEGMADAILQQRSAMGQPQTVGQPG